MVSRYKYFPTLLLEYNKNVNLPAKVYPSPLIQFHYEKSPLPYYVTNFELNPFTEESVEIDSSIQSIVIDIEEPADLVTGPFRGAETDSHGKPMEILPRLNTLPYLFIPHDSWWEYESFLKFPDYTAWYGLKFKEWHKYMIMKDFEMISYDPMWCIDPRDPFYDFYMYYYVVTLKYYKHWKSSIPSEVLYSTCRPYIYIVCCVGIYFFYFIGHLRSRTRWVYILLNEDWWIKEYEDFKQSYNYNSPYSHDDETVNLLTFGIPKLLFRLRYGNAVLKEMEKEVHIAKSATKEKYYELIKK